MTEIEKVRTQLVEKRKLVIKLHRECQLAEEWLAKQNFQKLKFSDNQKLVYQQGYGDAKRNPERKPKIKNKEYLRGFKAGLKK